VELLASGRDGDIYALSPGLVLRRTRDGRSLAGEARTMQYAHDHGYPVPEVHELRADDTELVMERIAGPSMLDAMLRPWKMAYYLRMLADLLDRLHEIPAPDFVPQLDDGGDCLVHLDFHPLNVILSARGPVVIDWTNAARGHALSDVAASYVLLTCPRMPLPKPVALALQPVRRKVVDRAFARRYRIAPDLDQRIAAMAERKALDRNMHPDEVEAMHRLARTCRKGEAGHG
jgi:aminoglycoside phosphotransferase (APT) family kinase protein